MNKIILVLLLSVSSIITVNAHAAMSPLSVAIVPPVQFPSSDFTVTGLRASLLYGQHQQIYGFDFGLIGNITTQRFNGIAVSGLFNYTRGETTAIGAQLAGLTNMNSGKTNVYGLQAALGMNMNTAESSVVGIQLAAVNLSEHTDIYGLQLGLYNKAQRVYGFQIGLVNVVDNLHGLQIGLINFHRQGVFTVSPILNFGF